jgi:DNA polymerase-3 subunit beta
MGKTATEEAQGTGATPPGGGSMKFRMPQSTLAIAVERVLNVVPQKTTMPALGHLLVEAQEGRVRLTATDLDLTISTSVAAEVEQEGAVALPARRFSEIVRELDPQGDAALDVHRGNAVITAGRANFRILGIGAEDFPKVPVLSFKKGLAVPAAQLRKAIQKTVYCVSRDETRRALTGVLWEVAKDSMAMVGTDGHRLARISLPAVLDVEKRTECIVPTKALNQLLRLIGEATEEGAQVKLADDHVVFRCGDTTLFSRLIEGPFPRYQDVIPRENDKKVVVRRGALVDALRRVSLLSDTLTHQVRVTLRRDSLVLSARTQDVGEAQEEVEARYGSDEMVLGYNAQYLADVLRNIETDDVLLSLSTPLNAGLVEPLEQGAEENYLCLIMPLRLVE